MDFEVICISGKRMATVLKSLLINIRRKAGYGINNWTLLMELTLTIRTDGSLVWETAEVNCLAKAVTISMLRVRDFEEKVMG